MKKWIKVLIAIFTVFIIILSTAFIIASISPYPTAWLVRGAFGLSSYSEHIDLETTKDNITILENIEYPSKYRNNNLEIIYPTDYDEAFL